MKEAVNPPLAPEGVSRPAELILSLDSRFCLDESERASLARAAREASPAEWEGVVREVTIRFTGGLLCHHLRAAGIEPPLSLQKKYRKVALAQAAVETELRRIAPVLREAGVRVLLIKGAALKGLVYENPGVRPAGDADWVLRTKEDWERAARTLGPLGYEPSEGGFWIRGPFEMAFHLSVV